jgi:hypothetical protein
VNILQNNLTNFEIARYIVFRGATFPAQLQKSERTLLQLTAESTPPSATSESRSSIQIVQTLRGQ